MEYKLIFNEQEQRLLGLDRPEFAEIDAILLLDKASTALGCVVERQASLMLDNEVGLSGMERDASQRLRGEQEVVSAVVGRLAHLLDIQLKELPPQVQR